MASQNGIGAGNAAMYGGGNGAVLPSPGYHSDMQTLMENMEKLSGTLQRNRQEWMQVQDGLARVERLQGRLARDGQLPLVNGDSQSHETEASAANETPTTVQLQNELAHAHRQINDLKQAFDQQVEMQEEYKNALDQSKALIRNYWTEEHKYIHSLHSHYKAELDAARRETIDAQLTHQAWQAQLQRLDEGVTAAFKSREEEGLPYRRRIAALKEENRVLRAKVGWDPPVDSDEEAWDEEDRMSGGDERGRASRESQGAAEGNGAAPGFFATLPSPGAGLGT